MQNNNVGIGFLIWIIGLAGSGKTTIAREVYKKLNKHVSNLVYIDGDEFRQVLGGNQQYDKKSRIDISYQKANLCKILTEQNINVISSSISLFNEIKKRNKKGLYSGKIKNVVGMDISFDKPSADLILDNTSQEMLQANVDKILSIINL